MTVTAHITLSGSTLISFDFDGGQQNFCAGDHELLITMPDDTELPLVVVWDEGWQFGIHDLPPGTKVLGTPGGTPFPLMATSPLWTDSNNLLMVEMAQSMDHYTQTVTWRCRKVITMDRDLEFWISLPTDEHGVVVRSSPCGDGSWSITLSLPDGSLVNA